MEKCIENVQILAENKDGSIFGHITLSAIKLSHLSLKNNRTPFNSESNNNEGEE